MADNREFLVISFHFVNDLPGDFCGTSELGRVRQAFDKLYVLCICLDLHIKTSLLIVVIGISFYALFLSSRSRCCIESLLSHTNLSSQTQCPVRVYLRSKRIPDIRARVQSGVVYQP